MLSKGRYGKLLLKKVIEEKLMQNGIRFSERSGSSRINRPDVFFAVFVSLFADSALAESVPDLLDAAWPQQSSQSQKQEHYPDGFAAQENPESKAHALRELQQNPKVGRKIQFVPITLLDGMTKDSEFSKEIFGAIQTKAQEVDLDLKDILGEDCVYRQRNDDFFILFYNQIQSLGCPREYLIQKVLLEKVRIGKFNKIHHEKEYLVEVMEIDGGGSLKGGSGDEHYRMYNLGLNSERFTEVTLEMGCGEIPGVVEGDNWPFDESILYKLIQDYAGSPGLYDKVEFDFSETFKFSFKFSKDRNPQVVVPSYSCKEF